uniref:Uncharacterized protein n=1 Tax=Papio anubis TaxID=9555 RepID=A0A8I5NBX1_PAPAN
MGVPVLGHWWHVGGMSLAVPSLPPPGKSSVFLFLQEKKANNDIHKTQMEQLETINILTLEKADLKTTLYHTKRAARHFEEESKDLAGRLQSSLQRIQELERALSAVCTQQREEDRVSPTSCPVPWQPGFPDGGVSLKVPSAGCSVLPRRQRAHFSLLLCVVVRGSLGLSQLLWVSWGHCGEQTVDTELRGQVPALPLPGCGLG